MALPDWTALALFVAMVLAVALYGLAASAQFPAEERSAALRGGAGRILLWATMAVAGMSAGFALRFALVALPGYAAVLAAGVAVLGAPLAMKPLPDWFLDGPAGLVVLAGLAGALGLVSAFA